jgi:hypothetical protein
MTSKKFWFGMAAVMLVFGLVLAGCTTDGGEGDGGANDGGIDWTSYDRAGTYSIRVKNESNRDLVAFKTSLSTANILGGVRKQAGDHGLKLNTTLFPAGQSQDFSIIFLTREDYEQYKGNLSSRDQSPFTRIFAAYNASGTNETTWIVSGSLGGNGRLVINNMTGWNMELRLDSPRGTTLGYAPYEAGRTTLYMNEGSVFIFPVFKQYNKTRDEIVSIYPRANDGIPTGDEFSFVSGKELTISAGDYIDNKNMSSGAAYLVVHNGSRQGITVYNGNEVQKTVTGISTINAGDTRTFTILMDGSPGGYESSKSISGWRVVNMGVRSRDIPATSLDADYRYMVEVTGNWSDGESAVTVSAPAKGAYVINEFGNGN